MAVWQAEKTEFLNAQPPVDPTSAARLADGVAAWQQEKANFLNAQPPRRPDQRGPADRAGPRTGQRQRHSMAARHSRWYPLCREHS